MTVDRLWRFKVIRVRPLRSETIEIQAPDSYHAIRLLPDDLVSWDFHQYQDGSYSRPVPVVPGVPSGLGVAESETWSPRVWAWLFRRAVESRPADEEAA